MKILCNHSTFGPSYTLFSYVLIATCENCCPLKHVHFLGSSQSRSFQKESKIERLEWLQETIFGPPRANGAGGCRREFTSSFAFHLTIQPVIMASEVFKPQTIAHSHAFPPGRQGRGFDTRTSEGHVRDTCAFCRLQSKCKLFVYRHTFGWYIYQKVSLWPDRWT